MIAEIIVIVILSFAVLGGFLMIYTEEEKIQNTFTTICYLIVLIVYLWFELTISPPLHTNNSFPIVSLERNSEISGSFVLGFGGINTKMVYYTYEDLGQNQYKLRKLDANLIIVENDFVVPHYEHERYRECWKDGPFYDCEMISTIKKIYVPVGTIRKEFRG